METDSSDRFKVFSYFICGFGLGSLISHYYCTNNHILEKQQLIIKILDNKGTAIQKSYHFDKNNNYMYFKEVLNGVNIKITFDNGIKKEYSNFTGNKLAL